MTYQMKCLICKKNNPMRFTVDMDCPVCKLCMDEYRKLDAAAIMLLGLLAK